ncbi:putative Ig domain-containing protein (plasmid) [Klebsiella sp. WOUb02]|uniref:putative Ig domain-containing protein n=1 Tax=Klebsiella sp. WOUb02 TaxID=3161071 RepID=UPI003CFA880A
MTTSRSTQRSRLFNAWALEPRMMFDAAAVATAAEVAQQSSPASTDAPGLTATPVDVNLTVTDNSDSFPAIDLFSSVSVSSDASGETMYQLNATINTTGLAHALVIDGSTIALEGGSVGETANNGFFYEVSVSGSETTITISIESSLSAYTNEGVAALIDSIAYQAQSTEVTSGDVTVSLALSDNSQDETNLSIASTIHIVRDSNTPVAPVLSTESSLEAAESFDSSSGLAGADQVSYSVDGRYVYTAGADVFTVFSVDALGRLTQVSNIKVEDLGSVSSLVVSGDGKSVYSLSTNGNLIQLDVNDDGTLSYVATYTVTGDGGSSGSLAISADGTQVYADASSNYGRAFIVYSRDASTGALIQLQEIDENIRQTTIIQGGDYLYVVNNGGLFYESRKVFVYQRTSDGKWEVLDNTATLEADSDWSGEPDSIAVSSDGLYVYINAKGTETLDVYNLDETSGFLNRVNSIALGSEVDSLSLDSNGEHLYVVTTDGAISVYGVSGSSLTLQAHVTGGSSGDLALSSDGLSLIIASGSGITRYSLSQTINLGERLAFSEGLSLSDSNFDVLNDGNGNYNGASITVSASAAGGSFGFSDGSGLTYSDGTISFDDKAIATLSVSDGVLTVKFIADADTATANLVLRQLTYTNDGSTTVGSYIQLTVSVNDGQLTSNSLVTTLRVNAVPLVNTDAANGYQLYNATSETAYSFTLFSGLFSDVDGDNLTWSVRGLPAGLTFDAMTRTISGSATETGNFTVTITVSEASGASASLDLELVVTQIANRAPEINYNSSTTLAYATAGIDYSSALDSSLFTDADSPYGDILSWAVSGLPDGFTFDADTLTISGSSSAVGDYAVIVTATDKSGVSVQIELTLRVISLAEANNHAPGFSTDASSLVYTSGTLSGYGSTGTYVNGLVLSSDETTLVVASSTSNNGNGTHYLNIYSRDVMTGVLTLVQTFTQGATDDPGTATIEIDGLQNVTSVTYSADGSQLYLTGYNTTGSVTSHALVVFNVNDDGTLSYLGHSDNIGEKVLYVSVDEDSGTLYALSATKIYAYSVGSYGSFTLLGSYTPDSGFGTAVTMRVVGDTAYVLSGSRLTVYSIADSGTLSYVGQMVRSGTTLIYTNAAGVSSESVTVSNSNILSGGNSLTVSDQGYIYLTTINGFLTTLHYDSESGEGSYIGATDAYGPLGYYPYDITLSADGTALYMSGANSNKIIIYSIGDDGLPVSPTTLTTSGGISRVAISRDGTSIYGGKHMLFGTVTLSVIQATGIGASFVEGGTSIHPAADLSLSDAEYDVLNEGAGNYNGAIIAIARDGGADSCESYGFTDGNGLVLAEGIIYLDGTSIATFSSTEGSLTVTFTADVTTATANRVLQQITYTNTSNEPGSSILLMLSVADQYTSSSIGLQLSVTEINNAPSLEASGRDITYTSGGNAVKLFEDVTISAGESAQTINSLTLTVSGLADDGQEALTIGGALVPLTDGVSVNGSVSVEVVESDGSVSSNSYIVAIHVNVADGVATVTISGSSGLPTEAATKLVENIGYINTSSDNSEEPTSGVRTVTLTAVKDSGGTDNDGVDTAALSISATVTVGLTNRSPSVTASGLTASYAENGDAVTLFSDVEISTGEKGQAITNIVLTISELADGVSEVLVIDGTAVSLMADTSGETTNGYSYYVSLEGDTATVYLNNSEGVSSDDAVSLLQGVSYANTSDDPTEGARTVTISRVQDDGGTANGGSDTIAPDISASVLVTAVNDAPILEATAGTVSYVSGGDSVSLFSNVAVSTVESGQLISSAIFTVMGLLDGGSETLNIDGTSITLAAGSGTTDSGYLYTVTVDGDIATVIVSFSDGLSTGGTATLIEGVRYVNLDSTKSAGTRTVSVSVQDSGGGDDTSTSASRASIVVVENSPPLLSADASYNNLTVSDRLTAINGLSDIAASTLSSDGSYLYVISSDGSIAIFMRNTSSGELVLQQTLSTSLSSTSAVIVNEDGSAVYVLGEDGDALAVYSRDASDGGLTPVQTLVTQNVTDFSVSSNGGSIYVIDGNYSGLLVYTRDGASGEYALSQRITASTSSAPYLFTGVSIDTVGDYVYVVTDPVADSAANTLIVYQVGSDDALTAVAYLRDGDSGVSLASPVDIAVSNDSGLVYVASADSIAIFSFDAASSAMTYISALTGLSDVSAVALSIDNGTLYVTSLDGSIRRFGVGSDGTLTLLETLNSSEDAVSGVTTGGNGAVVVLGTGGLMSLKDGLADRLALEYTEQGSVLLVDVLTLSDTDYDALNNGAGNYNGATIGIVRADGAESSDNYGFTDGNGLTLTDGMISLNDSAIATFTVSDGALTLVFTADVSTEVTNRVLQQISYTNSSDDPAASVLLMLSVTDAYDASTRVTLALNVTAVNDAPTLTASVGDVGYTEGDVAVTLFSDVTVDTIEAGQSVSSLSLTISGVNDGENETLKLDGTSIALVAGSGTTSSGYSYSVMMDGDTVVLILSSTDGVAAASLIDGIAYANVSNEPTEGDRIVTLTSVSDNGGTDNGGSDTTALAIATIVSVSAVNDAPSVTAAGASVAYTEGDGSVTLFSNAVIDTVEADQNVVSLTIIVSGVSDGASENLTVDGSVIALVAGSGTTVSGYSYTVTVDGGAVTLTISNANGIAAANLIDAVTYANDSNDPTEGVRSITLSSVTDGDGSNPASPAISASVTLSAVNDTPIVAASGATAIYTEGDSAVTLFSYVAIDVIEASQSVSNLTLTVSGISDGASETLIVDGTTISLVAGSGTTVNGYSWTVAVNNGVATLGVSNASGITDAPALLNGIAYANASEDPTGGVRTVTLTHVQDNGGGADSIEPNISTSVTIVAVNDEPQASAEVLTLAQATRDKVYSATLSDSLFSDVDDGSLRWSLSGLPDGLTFDTDTLTISGSPNVAGHFILTLTATDAQGAQGALNLMLTVNQREVNPVVPIGGPGIFDAAPQGGIFDNMTDSEDRRRQAVLLAGEMQQVSSLATGPLDYAAVPWVIDPIMPSLMPPLETVNFTATARGGAVTSNAYVNASADRVYRLPGDASFNTVQLANGRPLPWWVHFDAQRGELRLNDAPRVGQIQLLLTRADGIEQLVTLRDGQVASVPVVEVDPAVSAVAVSHTVVDGDVAAKASFSQALMAERGDSNALLQALLTLVASGDQSGNAL